MSPSTPDQPRILLVEDDVKTAEAVCLDFSKRGFLVMHASSISQGTRLAGAKRFDAVILDVCLPDGNGTTLAQRLREAGSDVPILMVTGQTGIEERIDGLGSGADDYICKPFSIEELAARLRAVWRRSSAVQQRTLKYFDVELDLIAREVRREKIVRTLSAREVELLAFMMTNHGELLSKQRLLREVWGDENTEDANVLQVYANYLRNKIEGGQYPRLIHTVRGVGYVFSRDAPDENVVAAGAPS